jgi:hypothetical protein
MKKSIPGIISILLFSTIQAQVVINSSNMPVPADIITMRTAATVNGANYTTAGNNHTWDFTALSGTTEVIDTFVSVLSTPLLYNVAFSSPFDQTHLATVAQKQSMPAIPMITISDGYSFQKNSTSQYSEVGVGLTISGATLPLKFDNPDVRYKFPVTYGTSDSTDSKYSAIVPGLGYYGEKRHRVNVVDGWGVLYLPNDTFNVIRVKSTVKNIDTIYVTALTLGMNIPRNVTEYKWLAPGHHEPVLEIDQTLTGVTVRYYSHIIITSIAEDHFTAENIKIFPNPATDELTVNMADNTSGNQITILDITGKQVYSKFFDKTSNIIIPVSNLANGLYFIRLSNAGASYCRKFIKE